MTAKLYVVPASHPCATVIAALELKGVPYRTVAWVPAFHKLAQKAEVRDGTVPGIVFDDGAKVLGSRAILRELEARVPEPAALRRRPREAELAEAWGDQVLQPLVRRVLWHALSRGHRRAAHLRGGREADPADARAVAGSRRRRWRWLERRITGRRPRRSGADLSACRATSSASTPGSRTARSAASGPTPPTCRSRRACGCCSTLDDLRR